MTDFLINKQILAQGEMTVQQVLTKEGTIVIQGIMTLDKYIEEIEEIDTDLFVIVGVTVIKETFGTKEKKVVYEFIGTGFGLDEKGFNGEEK